MKLEFSHRQSAHCESGVTANLFRHQGIALSEAMVFGLGSGLFFGYLPMVRINALPLITFRNAPGGIFKRVTKRLGARVKTSRFRRPARAMAALDRNLGKGIPTGLQTGVFWLPYFPPALRFHFNAHNLVVTGKEGEAYRISDPVLEETVLCPPQDLARARFAKGALAPRGRMFVLEGVSDQFDLPGAVRAAIRETCRGMVKTPVPFIGVKGIRLLARRLEKWPEKLGARKASLHLGHLIRMQEEIGTGGGGFRFIYAAFLQEVADLLGESRLQELSKEMTAVGDRWRDFALLGARHIKGRGAEEISYPALAGILRECADREEELFRKLLLILA
ncbi:NlpC/p60-like transpeptidase [Desulfuromonas soudanensis]|uniref:NlpC/p60-like transpeptidase n=1 Tax=Desulfuromonas soudanensis TaxID=1603606 RepID=A0A0M4D0G2_9BACT|nr:BtrH N-terminal domain-containing protein [Desulfuromonas soudanensis]ALC16021.1 NlpC/p60-like transpeptidase [Desulfuromonas soudanensis]